MDRKGEVHTCGICGRAGHDRRTCPYPEITEFEIKTKVFLNDKSKANLEMVYEGDVVTVYLDGMFVFSANWTTNIREFILLALKNWKKVNYS